MKKLVYLLLGILVLSSCETNEDIVDFPVVEPKLVVNCVFTENEAFEFQVSKSLSIIDNADLSFVENATVRIYDGTNLLETINKNPNDLFYYSSFNPELNKEYEIVVSAPKFDEVQSKASLPAPVDMDYLNFNIEDSGSFYYIGDDSEGFVEGNVNLVIKDPPGNENFYLVSIYKIDTIKQPGVNEIYHEYLTTYDTENPAIDYYNYKGLLLNDHIFDGQQFELNVEFYDWNYQKDQKVYVALFHLTKDLYLYYKTVSLYDDNYQNPFSNPVQLYNNIENGYGIFGGYSVVVDSFVLK